MKDISRNAPPKKAVTNNDCIRNVPMFAGCNPAFLDRLVFFAEVKMFAQDQIIVHEGDVGETMFIINRGEVSIEIDSGEPQPKVVTTLCDGQFFGEISLLGLQSRRMATVRAKTFVDLRELSRTLFNRALRNFPYEKAIFEAEAARRFYESRKAHGEEESTLKDLSTEIEKKDKHLNRLIQFGKNSGIKKSDDDGLSHNSDDSEKSVASATNVGPCTSNLKKPLLPRHGTGTCIKSMYQAETMDKRFSVMNKIHGCVAGLVLRPKKSFLGMHMEVPLYPLKPKSSSGQTQKHKSNENSDSSYRKHKDRKDREESDIIEDLKSDSNFLQGSIFEDGSMTDGPVRSPDFMRPLCAHKRQFPPFPEPVCDLDHWRLGHGALEEEPPTVPRHIVTYVRPQRLRRNYLRKEPEIFTNLYTERHRNYVFSGATYTSPIDPHSKPKISPPGTEKSPIPKTLLHAFSTLVEASSRPGRSLLRYPPFATNHDNYHRLNANATSLLSVPEHR